MQRWYSTKEAAQLLGISENTIRRRIDAGELKWHDIGVKGSPRIRIAEDDLDRFVRARNTAPAK